MQTPAPFAYARADSAAHALALLQQIPESRILAGGHSLLPMMKLRLASPECLIDIGDVAELDYVVRTGDEFRIGAMTRHASLLADNDLTAALPDHRRRRAGHRRPDRPQSGHHRRLAVPGGSRRGSVHGLSSSSTRRW